MKPIFLFLIALLVFASACRKMDLRPKKMNCEISGELLVWESEKKVKIDPDAPPTIMVMEQKYYKPWSPYREPIYKTLVNKDGTFTINVELEKEGEYYLELAGFDAGKYVDNAPSPRLIYKKSQVLDYRLVAFSWVTPRFINHVNLPGDTFQYYDGIGGKNWPDPFVGYVDTIMPWIHLTWGGGILGKARHFAYGTLNRNGLERDTKIYYFVPPGDTSIVEIRY
jgi:hypothetical protein